MQTPGNGLFQLNLLPGSRLFFQQREARRSSPGRPRLFDQARRPGLHAVDEVWFAVQPPSDIDQSRLDVSRPGASAFA
jgi:hypothetical protein